MSATPLPDYTATVAARVQGIALPSGEVVGVRSVYGSGQNLYADPLRPGQMIQPAPDKPIEAFTHVSDLPQIDPRPQTQSGTFERLWILPMRFYVPRGDLATVRQTLLPFYDGYDAAFATDRTLGGLCLLAYIKSFTRDADPDWAWLAMDLSVLEEVSW